MSDVAELGFAIDPTPMERAAYALDKFAESGKKVQDSADKSGAAAQRNAAQLSDNAAAAKRAEGAQAALAKAIQGLQYQMGALAGNLGLAGNVLASFGPWGLAAAAGLGALVTALNSVKEASEKMGQKAIEVIKIADVTGLTVEQLSALKRVARESGVDTEEFVGRLVRLTTVLNETSQASGPLYDVIRQGSGAFADQIEKADGLSAKFYILAKAFLDVEDKSRRAAIATAAGGRGAAAVLGPVLEAVGRAGSLDSLVKKTSELGPNIEESTKKWKDMEIAIKAIEHQTEKIWQTLAVDIGQDARKATAESLLQIAKAAKEVVATKEGLTAWQRFMLDVSRGIAAASGHGGKDRDVSIRQRFSEIADEAKLAAARKKLEEDMRTKPVFRTDNLSDTMLDNIPRAKQESEALDTLTKRQEAAAATANKLAGQLTALGTAATITQQMESKLAQVETDRLNNKFSNNAAENELLANRAKGAAQLTGAIQLEQLRNAQLGNSATVAEQVAAKQDQLNQANQQGAGLAPKQIADIIELAKQQALGTAQMKAQADAARIEGGALEKSAGAAAAYKLAQERIAEALRNKQQLTKADEEAIKKQAEATGEEIDKLELLKIASETRRERKLIFLSDTDVQIAEKLKTAIPDIDAALGSAEGSAMRFNAQLKDIKDLGEKFAQTFVHGIMDGKSAMDSLVAATNQLATALADKAIKDLIAGQWEKAAIEGIVAFGLAIFGNDQKAKKAQEEAINAWHKMAQEFKRLVSELTGLKVGGLQKSIEDALQRALPFAEAAQKAGDFGAIISLGNALTKFHTEEAKKFFASFEGMVVAFSSGFGANSSFAEGVKTVNSLSDEVQGFVSDAIFATGALSDASKRAADAGAKYLLSLLDTAPGLSDTQKEMQKLNGEATQLQAALEALGMSAGEAATAVADKLAKAMDRLRTEAIENLERKINEASGHGFLNEFTDLFKELAQLGSDPNLDPSRVQLFFHLQAQKLVDDADLVGDAFLQLLTVFPDLIGVVHESSKALEEQAAKQAQALKEAQDFLSAFSRRITEFVDGLRASSSSPLSPAARLTAAQSQYNAQLTLAQGGNRDALNAITGYSQDLIDAAKAYYGSSTNFQTIFNQILTQLTALPSQVSPEQLIVNAVDAATSAINAAKTTLQAAINANNPDLIKSALTPLFTTLDTNVNGLLDLNEFTTGLHGMASDAALASMFKTLDIDNSGSISRLDLIKNATTSVGGGVATSNTNESQLISINQILKDQLTTRQPIPLTLSSGGTVLVDNLVITALNKIVANTYATSLNTASIAVGATQVAIGSFAQGGLVGGRGTATSDSNLIRASRGEFMVNAAAARLWAPQLEAINDNRPMPYSGSGSDGASLAELRAIRAELSALRRASIAGHQGTVDAIGDVASEVGTAARAVRRAA